MRHRKILDRAADNPDASLERIAEEIPSATVDLVENVLDEYGDPAEEANHQSTEEEPSPPDTGELTPSNLTNAQRETLEAIHEQPEATQSELGELLGVTASTVCNRVNTIEGFEWENRHEISKRMVTDTQSDTMEQEPMSTKDSSSTATLDRLTDRVTVLEERIEDDDQTEEKDYVMGPELVHKVMHACLQSDIITEDEELQLLEQFL